MAWTPSSGALQVIAQSFACNAQLAAAIAAKARHADYGARDVLLTAGGRADRLFLVIDGHARMLALAVDGRFTVLEEFTDGDIFGEGALLDDGGGISDEVVAVEDTSACSLQSDAVVALMSMYGSIALAISRRLVARLNAQNRRFAENSSLSATGRIHAEIMRMAQAGPAMTIHPAPVLSQLALRLQTTRETVSRAISRLEKRGIIVRKDDALQVVAPHRLEELIY